MSSPIADFIDFMEENDVEISEMRMDLINNININDEFTTDIGFSNFLVDDLDDGDKIKNLIEKSWAHICDDSGCFVIASKKYDTNELKTILYMSVKESDIGMIIPFDKDDYNSILVRKVKFGGQLKYEN